MPNRYVRDELIKIALDMAQLPNLKVHDMPNGVVLPDAFSIQWLQDILDFWYHMVPFSAAVAYASLNCTANSDSIVLPSDFILDVRNGYITQTVPGNTQSLRRRIRLPLQKFINRQLASQTATVIDYPRFYCVVGSSGNSQVLRVAPTPNIATVGFMWYYQLPAVLQSADKPKFPNDYVCIEYARIRAREWAGVYEPGTSQKFCDKIIAGMKAAGLMNEPEDDEIPFDDLVYTGGGSQSNNSYTWLGPQ